MTTQGEDVLAYLDRAITAREEAARAVGFDTIEAGDYLWGAKYLILRRDDESKAAPEMDASLADHIALNDPSSVLRRCAADRKLIELHRPQQTGGGFPDVQECRTCSADSLGNGYQYLMPAPCPSLRALAEGYGRTEGKR
ncbi:DUF6221 family protein [Streptomyces sp. NPDC088115]|uniref:DUF6221 family protein n=1 Tax=Streptomyces sp. NPDC088115 TaxID=3365824 RepID=UPI0038120308